MDIRVPHWVTIDESCQTENTDATRQMTGERLQENNSSVMDKCPDVQTKVIQDGSESAIVRPTRIGH
ncbi:hypothetical protein TNCV_5070501 [Trichonephila clavipes]|nr:hypothetical protein TNCV_5070501 [Trichonephila clavipes]